jgi:3-oxoacyl-[acyl-carrier protein] reductase
MKLKDKVAIVTGSGRGIGRAIALRLAEAGASVVVNDIRRAAEEAAQEIQNKGGRSLAVIADVSSAEGAAKLAEAALAEYGRIDILINNAGINRDQLLIKMSQEDWDAVLDIDLKSVFLCTKEVIRTMIKQRSGRIISISSIVGLGGNARQANYAAAKAGIIGFTRSIAKEVASRGITANAIAPGFIDTEMTQRLPENSARAYGAHTVGCLGSTGGRGGCRLLPGFSGRQLYHRAGADDRRRHDHGLAALTTKREGL